MKLPTDEYTSEKKICPLCDRPMPDGTWTTHHLIPPKFGGTETIEIHKICHTVLHQIISEQDMLKFFHTIERIQGHESIIKFHEQVKIKPNDFCVISKEDDNNKSTYHK